MQLLQSQPTTEDDLRCSTYVKVVVSFGIREVPKTLVNKAPLKRIVVFVKEWARRQITL